MEQQDQQLDQELNQPHPEEVKKERNKRIKSLLGLVVILSLLVGGILFFISSRGQGILTRFSGPCDELEVRLRNLVKEANFCKVDSDCVSAGLTSCAFGCFPLVNRNADIVGIRKELSKYKYGCNDCLLQCVVPPTAEEIKCLENKCVDTRRRNNSTTGSTTGGIDISDWQTYRSDTRETIIEELGFEFKYPEGFELENNERDYGLTISRSSEYSPPWNFVTVFDPKSVRKSERPYERYLTWRDQFSVGFVKGRTAKEFAEYAYKYNEDYRRENSTPLAQSISVRNFQETTVGNYKAYAFLCDSHCSVIPWIGVLSVGLPHRAIYLQKEEFVFILLVTEKPVFDQILSTFRFLEPIDTSTWQVYQNDELGFEIRYPNFYIIETLNPEDTYPGYSYGYGQSISGFRGGWRLTTVPEANPRCDVYEFLVYEHQGKPLDTWVQENSFIAQGYSCQESIITNGQKGFRFSCPGGIMTPDSMYLDRNDSIVVQTNLRGDLSGLPSPPECAQSPRFTFIRKGQ